MMGSVRTGMGREWLDGCEKGLVRWWEGWRLAPEFGEARRPREVVAEAGKIIPQRLKPRRFCFRNVRAESPHLPCGPCPQTRSCASAHGCRTRSAKAGLPVPGLRSRD